MQSCLYNLLIRGVNNQPSGKTKYTFQIVALAKPDQEIDRTQTKFAVVHFYNWMKIPRKNESLKKKSSTQQNNFIDRKSEYSSILRFPPAFLIQQIRLNW